MKPLGKRKCEVLKKIRKMVADANGIKYEPAVCNHEGDCRGTCPQCEAEVKYLESELRKKSSGMGNAAAVFVGSIAAIGSIGITSTSCNPFRNQVVGSVPRSVDSISCVDSTKNEEVWELEGDVPAPNEMPDSSEVEESGNH